MREPIRSHQGGAAQPEVDELNDDDRKVQCHVSDGGAPLAGIVKPKKVNEPGHGCAQRAETGNERRNHRAAERCSTVGFQRKSGGRGHPFLLRAV
jgi:hypothetical protein